MLRAGTARSPSAACTGQALPPALPARGCSLRGGIELQAGTRLHSIRRLSAPPPRGSGTAGRLGGGKGGALPRRPDGGRGGRRALSRTTTHAPGRGARGLGAPAFWSRGGHAAAGDWLGRLPGGEGGARRCYGDGVRMPLTAGGLRRGGPVTTVVRRRQPETSPAGLGGVSLLGVCIVCVVLAVVALWQAPARVVGRWG